MDTPEQRWLTYREMAAALGLPSAKAALNRSRREGWPRRENNLRQATVAVPVALLDAAAGKPPRPPSRPKAGPPSGEGVPGPTPGRGKDVVLLLAELRVSHAKHVADLREQLERAERLATEERGRADAERAARAAAERRAEAAQAQAESDRAELAAWRAGGPLTRALRAFWRR